MDICICMAESLQCSSETTTKLLIGWTPIQNVFGVKKIKIEKKDLKKNPPLGCVCFFYPHPINFNFYLFSYLLFWFLLVRFVVVEVVSAQFLIVFLETSQFGAWNWILGRAWFFFLQQGYRLVVDNEKECHINASRICIALCQPLDVILTLSDCVECSVSLGLINRVYTSHRRLLQ